jgi:hypothetical protein
VAAMLMLAVLTSLRVAVSFFLNSTSSCTSISSSSSGLTPARELIGGGCRFQFGWPIIADHVVDRNNLDSLNLCTYLFENQCHPEDLEPALTKNVGCIAARVHLVDLLPHLTRAELTSYPKYIT